MEKTGATAIEADLASTRKALGIAVKDWRKIQTSLRQIDLKANSEKHSLISHEIGAVTVTLTTCLHLRGEMVEGGNRKEGLIVIPKSPLRE